MDTVEPAVFDSPDVISAASGLLVVRAVPIRRRVEVGRTRQVSISQSDAGVDAQEGGFWAEYGAAFFWAGWNKRKKGIKTLASSQPNVDHVRLCGSPKNMARNKETARMPSPDTRLRRALARPALPAMATKSAQSYAAFSFAARRGRAERRRSDNDSGSGSDSDSGNDSASNSASNSDGASNSDSASVEIIDDDENDENDENEPDVVVLGTASASSASSSTKTPCEIVRRYFTRAPRLDDPEGLQIRLFRRVFEDTRRNPNWAAEEDCSVCLTGLNPQIVLSCACRTRLFHINCIRGWHEQDDAAVQNLIRSIFLDASHAGPTCKQGAKPLHLAWVTPSAAEAAAKKQKRKQARRAKAKVKGSNEKQASKSRKAKVVRKAGKDAKMREEAAPGPEHPATGGDGGGGSRRGDERSVGERRGSGPSAVPPWRCPALSQMTALRIQKSISSRVSNMLAGVLYIDALKIL
ncbi:hypothetical protein B0H14DRAFT_2620470 [Mycena olivaceomarginata]|nr:hypothetical protein B0H14DRAFT_2620470 [Mycena olivaceomarginata]